MIDIIQDENNMVQRYIDDISSTLSTDPFHDETLELSILKDKEAFIRKQEHIERQINETFTKISSMDALVLALFIVRNECKKLIYSKDLGEWSIKYKIVNIFFFEAYKYAKSTNRSIIIINKNELFDIRYIISCIINYINNEREFYNSFYDNEAINSFFSRMCKISNMDNDLHSYAITNTSTRKCLELEDISFDRIENKALNEYANDYITIKELTRYTDWKYCACNYALKEPKDILRIPISKFQTMDMRLKRFLLNFEASTCKSPTDPETEFVFVYKHNRHYYISLSVMYISQEQLEKFIAWGQYPNLVQYYFGHETSKRIQRNYNRLLTYKIADLLLNNKYILPQQKKNGSLVPMIDIEKYTTDAPRCKELGDIDLTFYSEITKTIYLVEFKNYQMMVSRINDVSAEISKIQRDQTDKRIIARQTYIDDNKDEFISRVYNSTLEVSNIKSIILTTKPCFFYYLNQPLKYDYFDWIDFENRIKQKEL
ncbi:MAG: hypothetical protein K2G88_08810 [Oscillospiraceae bacterium]|nr:hypothetical protein [Oscillospiraceae bacterium]